MEKDHAIILANFGGPRSLHEVYPFLSTLLTDRDVVRSSLPKPLHNLLFKKIARKRSEEVTKQYQMIGGHSPIYEDTEKIAELLRRRLEIPILTFHRYLPMTHSRFVRQLLQTSPKKIITFSCFPQFTYATAGSIARWFYTYLPKKILQNIHWIKSYPDHPAFIALYKENILKFLKRFNLKDSETLLLFSAHGLPKSFINAGDSYERECQASFALIKKNFPKIKSMLAFQSKFGLGEWLRPYTVEVCEKIEDFAKDIKNVLFIPISFTSDHIETLYEIEKEYMPLIEKKNLNAFRLPAFNCQKEWIDTIIEIINNSNLTKNQMLIRQG